MIDNIYPSGPYMHISGPNGSSYINMTNPSAGMLRYNGNSQRMEVYDGYSWTAVGGNTTIGLSADAIEALDWARERMKEEQEMQKLAEQYPAMADALENLNRASEQVRIVAALVKENEK